MKSATFRNQTAVITGGLGDIGFAIALEFAKGGANVALSDLRDQAEAVPFLEKLLTYGAKYTYAQVDSSDANGVMHWLDEVETNLGTATLIIANAAMVNRLGFHEITTEQWKRELDVNVNGSFYLAQQATAKMLKKELPGRVVFIGSWAASNVHSHMPAYSVSKAAVSMLSKCMALELAPHDILVNEVAPGYVNAGLSKKIWDQNPGSSERSRMKVPIQKLISAEEVARQVLYLCDPENSHMTGSILLMDGGLSLM